MIIGPSGPISVPANTKVLFLESLLFDRTRTVRGSLKPIPDRISLESRWTMLRNPDVYIDNLVGSLDALEQELSVISGSVIDSWLVCLHSNDLLINSGSSKEFINRFKSIASSRNNVQLVLSISVPPSITNEVQGTEYLVSHINYGSSGGSMLFGMLGPLVIDAQTPESIVRMYLSAQSRTGRPVLTIMVQNIYRFQEIVGSGLIFDWTKTVVFSSEDADTIPHSAIIGLTFRPDDILFTNIFKELTDKPIVMSSGSMYKTDLRRYGGRGIDFAFDFLISKGVSEKRLHAVNSLALSLLEFNWDPPKLDVQIDDSAKWVCDVCGLTAKLSEKENYTKHGFTYCSIACLSDHRKRGFK